MKDSFTDELIKDLNKSERGTQRLRVSRRAVWRLMIKELGPLAIIIFIVGPLMFVFSAFTVFSVSNQISAVEGRVFQLFEVRGISVEIMSLKDPILSDVAENVKLTFSEFVEIASEHGMVYFSRPKSRFFVVGEHGDVIHYYDNESIDSIYYAKATSSSLLPLSILGGFVGLVIIYSFYYSIHKEMAGF